MATIISAQVRSAGAASLALVDRPYCNLSLDGPIAAGDLDKLTKLIQRYDARSQPTRDGDLTNGSNSICLNSDGGDFDEALKILQHLTENEIGATVDDGASCRSACAFVFMAGRYRFYHAITMPIRRLHVRGHLSFSAPATAADAAADAYADSVRKFAGLLGKASGSEFFDYHRVLPRTLLLDVLGLEPDQQHQIATIGQAGELNIEVVGFRPPIALTDGMLRQACINDAVWTDDIPPAADAIVGAAVAYEKRRHRARIAGIGPGGDFGCTVDAYEAEDGRHYIDISLHRPGQKTFEFEPGFLEEQVRSNGGDQTRVGLSPGTPIWYVFSPSTRLAELAER